MRIFPDKKPKEEYEFLPDALEIIESPISPVGSFTVWAIFALVMAAILWTYIGKIDMVSTAKGKVIPAGNVKVVQPFEEGIVTGIYVEDGQQVTEGQLLMDLDSSTKEIDVNLYDNLLEKAKLERKILVAIADGAGIEAILGEATVEENQFIVDYYNSMKTSTETNMAVMEEQKKQGELEEIIAKTNVEKLKGDIRYTEKAIGDLKKSMGEKKAEESLLESLETKYNFIKEEEAKYKYLFENGVIAENEWIAKKTEMNLDAIDCQTQKRKVDEMKNAEQEQLNSLNNELSGLKSSLKVQQNNVSSIHSKTLEISNGISNFESEENKKVYSMILEKDQEIENYTAQKEKGLQSLGYNHLYAPTDGRVYGLTLNTIGEVAKPGETVMTVVPEGTELVIESMLMNKDIGYIEKGQEVIVKIDTFPFQKFGTIKGTVIGISPNSYFDENNGYVYKLKIELEQPYLEANGGKYYISSGMEAVTEIKTGKRRIIDFFLEPLVKYIDESIKIR